MCSSSIEQHYYGISPLLQVHTRTIAASFKTTFDLGTITRIHNEAYQSMRSHDQKVSQEAGFFRDRSQYYPTLPHQMEV